MLRFRLQSGNRRHPRHDLWPPDRYRLDFPFQSKHWLDSFSDFLMIQGGPGNIPSPNTGDQFPVGPVGVDFSTASFDIPPGVDTLASGFPVPSGSGLALLTLFGPGGPTEL